MKQALQMVQLNYYIERFKNRTSSWWTVMKNMVHWWTRIYSNSISHNLSFPQKWHPQMSFIIFLQLAWTTRHTTPEFTPVFYEVCVAQSFVFNVIVLVDCCLSFRCFRFFQRSCHFLFDSWIVIVRFVSSTPFYMVEKTCFGGWVTYSVRKTICFERSWLITQVHVP